MYYTVQTMTQVMKASDARQQWSQLLNKVFRDQTRVVVEKSGIPVAAVISVEDLGHFIKLEEQRKERFKSLDRIRETFKNISASEKEKEVAKAVIQVRLEKKSSGRNN